MTRQRVRSTGYFPSVIGRREAEEIHMRKTVTATLIAVALGLMGLSAAHATPANGPAIGKAVSGLASFEQVQRRRRRRGCTHRRRSRMQCD